MKALSESRSFYTTNRPIVAVFSGSDPVVTACEFSPGQYRELTMANFMSLFSTEKD